MSRVALDLGFIKIYYYTIFILLAIVSATYLIIKEARKQNIDKDFLINTVYYVIIFGILGARLYYVIFEWDYYVKNPLEIFAIWHGGLAIHGGIIVGLIFILYYCHKNKVSNLKLLDIVVVGLILAQAIGRWGNFFNQEAYGAITTKQELINMHIPQFIINGMYIDGNYYQPTFLYESILDLLGFVILFLIRCYPYLKIGFLTGLYLIWYGVTRFFVEGMRSDSLMLGPLKMAQVVSIMMIICGIYFCFIRNIKSKKFENLYQEGGIRHEV